MIYLTRRATFSASHYYWNDAWTAEKNEQVFGRCANRNGHGHNYTLEVTVAGEPDPVTGFVVDLKWLKDVMEREVLGGLRPSPSEPGSSGVCQRRFRPRKTLPLRRGSGWRQGLRERVGRV